MFDDVSVRERYFVSFTALVEPARVPVGVGQLICFFWIDLSELPAEKAVRKS